MMFSCSARRHVFLLNENKQKQMSFVEQEDRRHAFLLNEKTCLLVEQEGMSSCGARRHVLLFSRRRHVFLFHKEACLLVQQ